MSNEKEGRPFCFIIAESFIVKSGNNRFAGTCCCYNQVAVKIIDISFHLQAVKYCLLMRKQLITSEIFSIVSSIKSASLNIQFRIKFFYSSNSEIFKMVAIPISFECCNSGFDYMRVFNICVDSKTNCKKYSSTKHNCSS